MKKVNPFFSLIIPVYNVEPYLERCLESILSQKFNDYEIILVDDGSKDNSGKICDDYAKKYEFIKVIHKKNEGLGYARNSGLSFSSGKYIWFIDSDDTIDVNSLSFLYNELNDNFVDLICFGFSKINSNNKKIFDVIPKYKKQFVDNDTIKNDVFLDFIDDLGKNKNFNMSACMCCIKKSFIDKYNIFFKSEREFISEDFYFFTELFNKVSSLLILDLSFYNYYINNASLTMSYKKDRLEKNIFFYEKIEEYLVDNKFPCEAIFRFYNKFIAALMAIIKSEIKHNNMKKGYNRIVEICDNDIVRKYVLSGKTSNNKNWNIFIRLFKNRYYGLIYLLFSLKNLFRK